MNVSRSELDRLQADPNVLTIAEDQPLAPQLTYSVPLIGAPLAWQAGATGAGQTVAVIDHGTQTNHPFLFNSAGNSKVVYEANCSPVCTPGKGKAAWPDTAVWIGDTRNGRFRYHRRPARQAPIDRRGA